MSDEFTWHVVEAGSTLAVALATWVLAGGIILQFRQFREEQAKYQEDKSRSNELEKFQFYATLDQIYYRLQEIIIGNTHLSDPSLAISDGQKLQYNAYAFMVWNFIEAVFDYSEHEGFEMLRETWGVIILYEGKKHKAWFLDPKNQDKFKHSFRKYADLNILQGQIDAI